MRKTVLIADDHPVYLLGLHTLVNARADLYQVVHQASNADEVMSQLAEQAVDIIITDLSMPGIHVPDGMAMIEAMLRRYPETMIVVITMITNPALLASLRRLGVHAVLNKSSLSTELIATLRSVDRQRQPEPPPPAAKLTQRETEVVRMLLRGFTVNQISQQLNRTKQTISTQKTSAMRKLGATTDYELFQCAQSLGLDS